MLCISGDDGADRISVSFLGPSVGPNINIVDPDPNNGTIRLSGRASDFEYANVLGEIEYRNVAEEPGRMTRHVLFTIVDEVGVSAEAITTIEIMPTNDRPVLTLATRDFLFDESARLPLRLFNASGTTISDNDGDSLDWVTVNLTPGVDSNDRLTADVGETGLEMAITYEEDAVLLNISGTAMFSVYEEVLGSVEFVNTFPGISQVSRRIVVELFDGGVSSVPSLISISISGFNDPPLCFFSEIVRLLVLR